MIFERAFTLEIQQLRHLLAAIESGNLLKAADKSCISQSGLSRSIKSLENRLGVQLLIRGPKGVEPTIYGLSVMRRAQVILNEVSRSVDEVKAIEEARVGEVKFGITQNYAGYIVPDLLADVHNDRPGMRFTIVTDGFLELLDMVKSETIEFAFGLIGQIHRNDGIVIEPIHSHHSQVFCSHQHPLAKRKTASLQDLHNANWAMLNSEGVQRAFAIFFESRGMTVPYQIMKTDSIELIRNWLEHTNVLTVLPAAVIGEAVEGGRIVPLECETPVAQTRVGIFYREGSLLTPQAELLIERFRNI
jgi:DNA-binding transcriptional LysR family regulator